MKLMFKYTQGGQSKRLLIEATDTGITFNYSEFMYKSSSVYYGWKDIISPGYGKYYCQQGDSWLEQYHAGSLSSVFNFTGENTMKLSASDSFHGSGTNQWSNGIELTYGEDDGTCEFSWYTFTEYTPDPVSHIVSGGLFDFCPDGNTSYKYGTAYPYGSAVGYGNIYTTESAPSISFWTAKMYDDYNTGREEYHKTFDVLVIAISESVYEGSIQRAMFTIVDMRLLNGADIIKPSKSTAKGNTPMGFRGDRNDESDSDTVSTIGWGLDTAFVNSGSHGVQLFRINSQGVVTQYNTLYNCFWNENFWDGYRNAKWSPLSGVLSFHIMPCEPTKSTGEATTFTLDQQIRICGLDLKYVVDPGPPITYLSATGDVPANSKAQITTDIFNIKEYTESFLDWGSNTRVRFRLPFIGTVPIEVSKVMDGGIFAKYNIDFLNGNCLVQIYTIPSIDVMGTENDWNSTYGGCVCMIGEYTGNCAYKLNFAGNDHGGNYAAGYYGGIASSAMNDFLDRDNDPWDFVTSMLKSTVGGFVDYKIRSKHNTHIVPAVANSSVMGMMIPAVIIDRPIDLTPLDGDGEATVYEYFNGRPAASGGTVKDYKGLDTGSGLFIKGILHADTLYATENEKQEIERAFAKGVYI